MLNIVRSCHVLNYLNFRRKYTSRIHELLFIVVRFNVCIFYSAEYRILDNLCNVLVHAIITSRYTTIIFCAIYSFM